MKVGDLLLSNKLLSHGVEAFSATLICTTNPNAIVTASKGDLCYVGQADTEGVISFNVISSGTYIVIAAIDGASANSVSVEIVVSGDSYTCDLPIVIPTTIIVPFATGTDEEIAAMMDAAKAGTIDLQEDGNWAVGDVRTIQIFPFTGGGNVSHIAQNIDIVITSFDDYNSCGAVMQFDFKDELVTGNRMNASNTNGGGYGSSEMYSTTLPVLVHALPIWLKDRLLEFSVLASAGNQASTINTITGNKLALRSEVEILGTTVYSKVGEGTQIPYYAISENRIKKRGHNGSAYGWWNRSPSGISGSRFCFIESTGAANYGNASYPNGFAPFGCI